VNGFLSTHALSANNIDAIVDLGTVNDMIPEGIPAFAHAFLGKSAPKGVEGFDFGRTLAAR
jgi:hypothetical protein